MKSFVTKLALISALLLPALASAHPGHGNESPLSPGHYVTNPQHFIPLALTVVVSVILILAYRQYVVRSRQSK